MEVDYSLIVSGFLAGVGFFSAETLVSFTVGFITQRLAIRQQQNSGRPF